MSAPLTALARTVAVAGATLVVATVGALVAVAGLPMLIPGWGATAIETGSMAPAIDRGDVVVLRPVDRDEADRGTVIRFPASEDAGSIVHRIVAVDPEAGTWTTRGDANRVDDRVVVPMDAADGMAALLVPGAGHTVLLVRQGQLAPAAALAAIGLVLVVLAVAPNRTRRGAAPRVGSPLTPWRIAGPAEAGAPLFSAPSPALAEHRDEP